VVRRRWRLLGEVVLVAAVLAAAILTFSGSRAKADGDEAEWIGTSRYFSTLFVDHDLSREAWAEKYWTRTQPMVARYVIGAWLGMRGYDLGALNPAYIHDRSWEANQRIGRAPSNVMRDEARVPMRALAALAATGVYLTVRMLVGPVGGLVAAGLFVGSPYLSEHLIRAKGDTTLICLLVLALLSLVVALRYRPGLSPSLSWGVTAGAFLGLAMGTKLTAFLGAFAIILWSILALAFPTAWAADARFDDRVRTIRWAGTVLGVAAIVFVASNPFLYPDPLGRTLILFENRQAEMDVQVATEPWRAYPALSDRVTRVLERSLLHETWGSSYAGIPIEAALVIFGFGWLAWRGARLASRPEAMLLAWMLCLFAGVSVGLRYLLQHYFLPTTVFAIIVAGIGAGAIITIVASSFLAVARRFKATAQRTRTHPTGAKAASLTAEGG
jgi:Dolichyl-phosphate-mannose-protein mannosyltransferase